MAARRASSGALQHELKRLQQADLLIREQDGNRVTYRANTRHPIFEDLRAIIHKTCGLDTKLADTRNTTVSPDTRFDVAYEALLQIGIGNVATK